MADQPERPIEKLLRECGKRRVPSDALELHPANRRLLQDEVARRYPKKERRLGWFGISRLPKLAWGFCAFSVVGLAVWLSMRPQHQTESDRLVAHNEKTLAPASSANAPIPAVKTETAPALQPNLSLADNLTAATQVPAINSALNIQTPASQLTDARTTVAMNLAEQELSRDAAAKSEFAGAALARAPEPSGTAGGVVRYGLASTAAPLMKQTYQPTTVQNFVQEQTTRAQGEQRAQPILASFQFEQSGSEIRIIDRDGSVYLGRLGPPPSQAPVNLARRDSAALNGSPRTFTAIGKPSPADSSAEFTFHVTGTNRTLRELISFDGRWLSLTNVPASSQVAKDVNRGVALDRQIAPAPAAAWSNASRIWGTAIIKGSDSVNINAISVQP